MALPQSPIRQQIRTFLTPSTADFIVAEAEDVSFREIPEYGTPHPDVNKYPSHLFCYAAPADENGLKYTLLYAMKRADQDAYNWEYALQAVGDTKFPAVVRSYVTLRTEFDPLDPEINAEMPDVPVGKFTGAFLLFDKQQTRSDDKELDSIFVAERHIYVDHTGGQTKTLGQDNLIPAKYRGLVTTKVTVTLHDLSEATIPAGDLLPDPDALTGDEVKIELVKFSDYQYLKAVTEEVVTGGSLTGSRAYAERERASVTETLVGQGTAADTGLYIITSDVDPVGGGYAIKTTVTAPSWTALSEKEWNPALGGHIETTEQFVAAGTTPGDYASTKIVNKDRSLLITRIVPTALLNGFKKVSPTTIDLQLPDVLRGLRVVWNEASGSGGSASDWNGVATGDSWSLSGSEGGSGSSSYSAQPELLVDIVQTWGRDLPAIAAMFYLPYVNGVISESALLAKAGSCVGATVKRWPVFHPEGASIMLNGVKVSIRATAQGGAHVSYSQNSTSVSKSTEQGSDRDYSTLTGTKVIPPCIHPAIAVTGTLVKFQQLIASASANWTGTNFPSININNRVLAIAQGSVTPAILQATTPDSIPTSGHYLTRSKIEADPTWEDFAMCYVEVFNSNVLR